MDNEEELYDSSLQEASEGGNNIGEIIFRYLKYWYWFLLSLAVFMVMGYFYVKIQVPQYSSQAQILIRDNSKTLTNQVVFDELNITQPSVVVDNEILILKSNTLVEAAIKDLGLQTSYFDKGPLNKRILYNNIPAVVEVVKPSGKTYTMDWSIKVLNNNEVLFEGKKVAFNVPTNTAAGVILIKHGTNPNLKELYYVNFDTVESIARDYINKTAIAPVNKSSNILILSIENAVPKRGEDFLNKLVEKYINASVNDKTKNIASAVNFVNERIKVLAIELDAENKNVQNYKSSNNITDLGRQASEIYTRVTGNDQQVATIELQLEILRNVERFLSSPDNVEVTQPSLLGLTDATVASQVSQLGDLKLRKQSLLRTVTETNPVVATINDQILSLKSSLNQTIKTVRSNLLLTKKVYEGQNAGFNNQLKQVPVKERELLDVMRNQGVKNTLFNFLLQKREEIQLSLASNTADTRIISPARSLGAPIKPVKLTLYMIFVALGLGVPFAVILIKEMLNNTVRRKSDISKSTKVPIIAQISHSDDINPLTIASKPKSIVAEQIRSLRTNLDFLIPGQGCKVILFTSIHSGEGKSFISLNLGASLASTGKKVIILELDLRKPKLLSTLALEKRIGLSDYLIGKVKYEDIIRAVPQQENFFLIESGTIPPNPAEILMSDYLNQLINKLKQEYDYVLIDAPPIGLVTDAQILSQYANVTFFLVRHNFTRKDQIVLINEIFMKKIFKNLNIIFNSIDTTSFGYGYRYDYSYYGEQVEEPGIWSKIFGKKSKR